MVPVTAAAEKNGSGLRWGSGHGYGRAANSGHEGEGVECEVACSELSMLDQ